MVITCTVYSDMQVTKSRLGHRLWDRVRQPDNATFRSNSWNVYSVYFSRTVETCTVYTYSHWAVESYMVYPTLAWLGHSAFPIRPDVFLLVCLAVLNFTIHQYNYCIKYICVQACWSNIRVHRCIVVFLAAVYRVPTESDQVGHLSVRQNQSKWYSVSPPRNIGGPIDVQWTV